MTQDDCLALKSRLLDDLIANAHTQIRFLNMQQFKGLQRILADRETLLQALAAVNRQLSESAEPVSETKLTAQRLQPVQAKEQQLLLLSRQAVVLAAHEKEQTQRQLQQLRAKRVMEKQYQERPPLVQGRRINLEG